MLKLHELPADPGKSQKPHRIGRGEGSGWGRTSGKGNKGQQARSGGGHKGPAFEGGQMPLIRRLPKFGFSNISFRLRRAEVTLEQLERFDAGTTVDFELMCAARLISKQSQRVKVLATGELTKKLTVKAHGFSAKARQAIEAAGGVCETI
jgi:large subunit ribosomal protein L15